MSRFELRRRLGEGGFGVVYEALDRQSGATVALKFLRQVKPRALYHFKREFRALADVTHENLVRLYELAAEDDRWYFTMELVRGVDLLDWVQRSPERKVSYAEQSTLLDSRPRSPSQVPYDQTLQQTALDGVSGVRDVMRAVGDVDLDRLREALAQLARGIGFLHDRGKLHCDIKPNNVLVTRDGQVKVLDFGLVADLGESHMTDVIGGTPAYMAPESMLGHPATPASDWYSVGVVLYEALTGTLPFFGSPNAMAAAKLEPSPPTPRALNRAVPDDLDALCRRLLDPEPRRRPDHDTLLVELGRKVARRASIPAVRSLVGRERELALLEAQFDRAKRGTLAVALVHGRSGLGKSALVEELLRRMLRQRPDTIVLSGRCHAQETVPYKAFDGIVDSLTRVLSDKPEDLQHALMVPDVRAVARLFPVLDQVRAVAEAPALDVRDPIEVRRRALAALRAMLSQLSLRAPLVLFVDDLHWGDADSATIVDELLRSGDAPPLLFVATYRTEEGGDSPLVQRVRSAAAASGCDLELGELDPEHAEELARALLGTNAGARAAEIAREAGGSPFFIDELARAPQRRASSTLDQLIVDRAAELPDSARRLLQVVALAGRPIPRAVARDAALLEHGDADELSLLRTARFVRSRTASAIEQLETYHDRIREPIARELAPDICRSIHAELARALELHGGADAEMLGVHHEHAGDPMRASDHYRRAAEQASAALAFDRAARLYRDALRTAGPDQPLGPLRLGLGEALASSGRGREAADQLLAAAGDRPPAEALELARRAAELLLNAGRIEQGLSVLSDVLARVNLALPATQSAALAKLLLARASIRVRGLGFEQAAESSLPVARLLEADTCWSVASGLGAVDTVRGAYFQAKNLLLCLELGEPRRVVRALAMEIAYTSTAGVGAKPRTDRLIEDTVALARRADDPEALATVTLASALAAFHEGQWMLARKRAESAEQLLRRQRTAVAFQLHNAQMYALRSLYYLGEWRELMRRLPILLRDAEERGDLFATTRLRAWGGYVADLARDDAAAARDNVAEAMSRWGVVTPHQQWYRVMANVEISLYDGDGEAAWQVLDAEWSRVKRSLQLRIEAARIIALHLRARAALAALPQRGPFGRVQLRSVAAKCAGAIERIRSGWGDPLALLIRAGLAGLDRDEQSAVTLLERAERGLTASQMQHFAHAAARRRAELTGDGSKIAAVDAWWHEQGMLRPEQFSDLLVPRLSSR